MERSTGITLVDKVLELSMDLFMLIFLEKQRY